MERRVDKGLAIRIAAILIITLFIVFGLPTVFKAVLGTETPFMVVISRSMEPTLKVNDIIVVVGVDPDDIEVGDIIVFRNPTGGPVPIVHRVVDIIILPNGERGFITKGDNNNLNDPWTLTDDYIIGRVVFVIPQLGIITRIFTSSPLMRYGIILLIVLAMIYLEYRDYLKRKEEEEVEEFQVYDCIEAELEEEE